MRLHAWLGIGDNVCRNLKGYPGFRSDQDAARVRVGNLTRIYDVVVTQRHMV